MRRYLKITLMTVLLPMAAMAAPRVEVLQDNLDHPLVTGIPAGQ